MPTLVDYIVDLNEDYYNGKADERWFYRFEVPVELWNANLMPARGAAIPPAIAALTSPAASGTVLHRHVSFKERPGYVACVLTCGWSGWYWFESLTRVSCRTVAARSKLLVALDGATPLAGPVPGQEERQRYAVGGDDSHDETFVQINIASIVPSIPAGWQGANFNKRNKAPVTIRGITYDTGKVLYVGGGSEDVPASQSPTGSAAYQLSVVLLAAGKPWPLTVTRYIEHLKYVVVPVVEGGVEKGETRALQWVRDPATASVQTVRGEFDMASALAALP